MRYAPIPDNEERRIAELYTYGLLDTPSEEAFDRITRTICDVLQVPIATVTLVDRYRQWFKSARGLSDCETPRSISFCGHVVAQGEPLIVEDAHADERFRDNPLVVGSPRIRAYLGVPLTTPRGLSIGVLCVQDSQPRVFDARGVSMLEDLAHVVLDELELRYVAYQREQSRSLFIGGPTVVVCWSTGPGWPVRYVSPNVAEVFGYQPGQLLGRAYTELLHPDDWAPAEQELQRYLAQGTERFEHEPYRILAADGSYRWVRDFTVLERDATGQLTGLAGYLNDITEHVELQGQLRRSASVFEQAREGIAITDLDGGITATNRALVEMTGYGHEELQGWHPQVLASSEEGETLDEQVCQQVRTEGEWSGEQWLRCRDGSLWPVRTTVRQIRSQQGQPSHYLVFYVDTSWLKAYESQLERLMHVDPLTGLPNRLLFMDRLTQAVTGRKHDGEALAVIALDLRDFRAVNDSLGRAAGDAVLEQVGERLRGILRTEDTVARLSGDEFGILLPRLVSVEDSATLADRIVDAVEAPYDIEGLHAPIAVRAGISVVREGGVAAESLLEQADSAMYEAKSEEARYRFFSEELTARARQRLELAGELRQALAQGQLEVHYQPQHDLGTGAWVGVEALARWPHPERGWVSPARFIPAAERAGLIGQLGSWVLEQACTQARAWLDQGVPFGRVAVNVAAPQLNDAQLVEQVLATLERAGLPGEYLELEITESLMVSPESAVIERLDALRRRGVRVAVDDFGTGYSTLSYLKDLPIDRLKIDRSFVQGMADQERMLEVIRAIIALGRSLRYDVIAEGIEEERERDFLLAEGCSHGQGFLLARPAAAQALSPPGADG